MGAAKLVGIGIIALIVIGVIAAASVQIVDAGHRGVLLHWNAVDVSSPPLEEGLHFVVPFQDQVVNMEVRTLKFVKAASSASKDLQTVSTEVTVNYHPSPESVNTLYKHVGLDQWSFCDQLLCVIVCCNLFYNLLYRWRNNSILIVKTNFLVQGVN